MTTVSSERVVRSAWWRPAWNSHAVRQGLTFGASLCCACGGFDVGPGGGASL